MIRGYETTSSLFTGVIKIDIQDIPLSRWLAMESALVSISIDPETPFRFACNPEVACFNECCRDLHQFLTPYDVLRLKRSLGLPSQHFLEQYTRLHTGPGSGLPVVTLKPADPERLTCAFVTPGGCRVYPDRPSSCRMYPLVRLLHRSRQTADVRVEYRLLREPHCRGFYAAHPQTACGWMSDQGLTEYNAENDRLLDVISLKARLSSGSLPPSLAEQVYTAWYDLDRFRERLGDGSLSGFSAERMEEARQDEVALLRLGLEWVKQLLERTFTR
jgi:Fe-S-cluster containining protein